jgi:hypothetical protein
MARPAAGCGADDETGRAGGKGRDRRRPARRAPQYGAGPARDRAGGGIPACGTSIVVWSDAMYEPKGEYPAAGGFVVYVPPERACGSRPAYPARVYAASHVTEDSFMRRMVHGKKTYIGQLEIAYAGAPYLSIPHVFRGRSVIHFVDNTSAVAALVKGYAKPIDSGQIVNAIAAYNAGLDVNVFWEYVRSKANIGDFPSRLRLDLMRAALRDAGIETEPTMVTCVLPSFDDWITQLPSHWLTKGRTARTPGRVSRGKRQRGEQG